MGGGGKRKKTKWRTFCPDSVEESSTPKQIQERNDAAENAPKLQESHPENESQFIDGSYQYGYDYPQGIIYPQPHIIIYNRFGMPFYPNFLVPSDVMYNHYYVQPPSTDGTSSLPIPEDNSPLYPIQLYNPSNNGPPVQEYIPTIHAPTAQECMPQMQGAPIEEFNPLMQVPAAQDFNPAVDSVPGYDPSMNDFHNPSLNDLNKPPFQDCADGGMQGPHAQDYNIIQFPTPKDPVFYIYPGQPIYPNHSHSASLNNDWRSRRKRRPYNAYRNNSFMTTKQNQFGNEEERYGSTVLRIKPRPGTSGNASSHGNTMTSEPKNFHGEDSKRVQEAADNQPSLSEDKHKSSRNMSSPTKDKNGNSKGHLNQKNTRKIEFCGTHSKRSPEKSESINNKTKSNQGKNTQTEERYQRKSSNEASKDTDGGNMESGSNTCKEDSKDGNDTTPQQLRSSTDKVSNEKKVIHSTRKSSNDSVLQFASIKANSIFKSTVDIPETIVKCLDIQKDVENSRKSFSKENIQQVDNDINARESPAEQFSPNNSKTLKEMQNSDLKIVTKDNVGSDKKCATTDDKVGAKGKFSTNKKVEKNESSATHDNVSANDASFKKYNVKTNGIEADKIKALQETKVKELVEKPFSCDSKGIDKHNIDNEHLKDDENIAFVEQNCIKASGIVDQHSFKNNNSKIQEEKVSQNQTITHNSLSGANKILNPVPKILNTTFKSSTSESSPNSKENIIEAKMEKNQNLSAFNILSQVPLDSNSTFENTVSKNKEISAKKLGESVTSGQSNSFDEKPLKQKNLIKPDGPFIPTRMEYNIKYEEEVQHPPPMSQSIKSNQSLYKISFNDSITSSETNSRSSLSPVDPESQVPSSIVNDEIIVHEADTDSDAGSEDVELIAHRYECETSLNRSKNIYVNKLSLAVELLRTQESLPYDAHFKRVVYDNDPSDENTIGEDNFGFEDDSTLLSTKKGQGKVVTTSPTKSNKLPGASSGVGNKNELTDSCEEAEEKASSDEKRDNTEEVKAVNRRFQIHLRHYFASRGSLINPCLCCVIM